MPQGNLGLFLGVTTRVGLFVTIFFFLKKKGFSLLSLTQNLNKTTFFPKNPFPN
jgi:hypothetical protein